MIEFNEIWKDITNYEGLYQVSNLGRVKSLERKCKTKGNKLYIKKEIILKERLNQGYNNVILYKNNTKKSYKVHRLVAEAFIPNLENKPNINHKNFKRNDNRADNLEWCTQKENIQYTFKNGNIENIINHSKELGKKYGGNKENIKKIKKKLSKKVLQIDKNTDNIIKIWESAMEIQRNLKIPNSNISRCCKGKVKTAGGYKWKHLNLMN